MEGRTNILPLVGGLVTGDVENCVVDESNGITSGQFVQIVGGSATLFNEGGSAKRYFWYKMSDGKVVCLRCTWGISNYKMISIVASADVCDVTAGYYTVVGRQTLVSLTGLTISCSNDNGFCLSEMIDTDKFFLCIGDRLFVFEYDSQNSVVELTKTILLYYPTSSYYGYYASCVVLSDSVVAFGLQISAGSVGIVLVNIDTEQTSSVLTPTTSAGVSQNNDVYVFKTSEYVVLGFEERKFVFCQYNLTNLTLSAVDEVTTSSIVWGYGSIHNLANDVFVSVVYGGNGYCTVFKIVGTTITIGQSISSYSTNVNFLGFYDGKILSFKNSVFCNYFVDTGNLSFEKGEDGLTVGSSFRSTSDSSYVLSFEGFCLVFNNTNTSSNAKNYVGAFFKNEQNVPVELSDYVKVKKYETFLSGVAKTSGSLGDTIQVYVPHTGS